MRNLNPSSKNGNVTTFCSGRRFFEVFSVSWKFYRENFPHTTFIRDLLVKTHLLNYNMWYFWPRGRFRPFRRDATATRMTKYWNSLNRRKRSFIPPLIIPETCRLIQDIASREVPQLLQTLCLKTSSPSVLCSDDFEEDLPNLSEEAQRYAIEVRGRKR